MKSTRNLLSEVAQSSIGKDTVDWENAVESAYYHLAGGHGPHRVNPSSDEEATQSIAAEYPNLADYAAEIVKQAARMLANDRYRQQRSSSVGLATKPPLASEFR